MNPLVRSISVYYRMKPKERAMNAIARAEKEGIVFSEPHKKILLACIQREVEIDRGEGMNVRHNQELWDAAFSLWKLSIKEYLYRIFNLGVFSCPVCGAKIRTLQGAGKHEEWCPLASYVPDFITDEAEYP